MSSISDQKQRLFFRNHLHHTDKKQYSKAWAFSPDIIPHYGKTVPVDVLKSSYDDFIAFPLQENDSNFVYLRAFAPENPVESTAVALRAIPNELILWPQIWNEKAILPHGLTVISSDGASNQPVANDEHVDIRLPTLSGFSLSFIAVSQPIDSTEDYISKGLKHRLTAPRAARNWREYIKFIEEDRSTTFYNVRVVDPTSPRVNVATRLRFFEDSEDVTTIRVQLRVMHAGLPAGTEVSLSSDHGDFVLQRVKLEDDVFVGSESLVAKDYDGFITLNVFPPSGKHFRNHGWVSLQAHVIAPEDGNKKHQDAFLLGAENIVFDAQRTRRARHYSHAACALEAMKSHENAGTVGSPATHTDQSPSSVPSKYWWFRDDVFATDSNNRSHYASPDIQIVGQHSLQDAKSTLSDPNVDYTAQKGLNLVSSGESNYIYLRGYSGTKTNTHVMTRLFVIPTNLLLTPQVYERYAALTPGGGIQVSEIQTTDANQFYVLERPFVLTDIPRAANGTGHCIVAEAAIVTSSNPEPDWPSEDVDRFGTMADMSDWLRDTPQVAMRNVDYSNITMDGGGPAFIKNVTYEIPAVPDVNDYWYTISVVNQDDSVDPNSEISLDATAKPGKGSLGFERSKVGARTGALHGSTFTGIDPDNGFDTILTLKWYPNGTTIPGKLVFDITDYKDSVSSRDLRADSEFEGVDEEQHAVTIGDFHPGLPKYVTPEGHRPLVAPIESPGHYVITCRRGQRHQVQMVDELELSKFKRKTRPGQRTEMGRATWLCKK